MKSLSAARETQRELDASLYEQIPQPDVFEDNSEAAWLEWDAAVNNQTRQS